MNKQEAYQALLDGYTIRNEYYSKEEWLKMNKKGEIKTEEGYTMYLDEWNRYQDPDGTYEWEVIGDADKLLHVNGYDINPTDLPVTMFNRGPVYDPSLILERGTKKQRAQVVRPVEPRSDINRNDPCMCGSGKKYKKCCGA
jgi:hypothetical protein